MKLFMNYFELKIFIAAFAIGFGYLLIALGCMTHFLHKKRITNWNRKERSVLGLVINVAVASAIFVAFLIWGCIYRGNFLSAFICDLLIFGLPLIWSVVLLVKNRRLNHKIMGAPNRKSAFEEDENFSDQNADYLSYRKQLAAYKNYRIERAAYEYELFRYKRGLPYDKKPPRFLLKLWANRVLAGICAAVIIVLIAVPSIMFPILTNKFRIAVVNDFELRKSMSVVERYLPEPDNRTENVWQYFSGNYMSLVNRINLNMEKMETVEDFETLGLLIQKNEVLAARLNQINYKYIAVEFEAIPNSGEKFVSRVLLDAARCDGALITEKKVRAVKLSESNVSAMPNLSEKEISWFYSSLSVKIYYKDGSYQNMYVPYSAARVIDLTTAGKYTLVWQDSWGNYSAVFTVR